MKDFSVAIIIPCLNEAGTIFDVVRSFQGIQVPYSTSVYVFDNSSVDGSYQVALRSGAHVTSVLERGKGNVVKAMLSSVDADVYVLVDGDGTYCPTVFPGMVSEVLASQGPSMVVASRLTGVDNKNHIGFTPLHYLGNRIITFILNFAFSAHYTDVLSGYRAFNRQFVDVISLESSGFEVEVEMSIKALRHRVRVVELFTPYRPRSCGGVSKLKTFGDGARIIFYLIKSYFQNFFSM
jgi:glycosyltransferase involved in cell wall biosynthesis